MQTGYVMAQGPVHPESVLHLRGYTPRTYRKQPKLTRQNLTAILHGHDTYIRDVAWGERPVSRLVYAWPLPCRFLAPTSGNLWQPLAERPAVCRPFQGDSTMSMETLVL